MSEELIKAVIFDWAGTIVDFGSLAPMGALVKLFEGHGVRLSVAEARIPMGLPKWNHIKALSALSSVRAQWIELHDREFGDADVDVFYAEFQSMSAASAADQAALIPGALDVVQALRSRGLKIGSTTGYDRTVMQVLTPLARAQGYEPDNLVCAGDLAAGRPSPLMMYRCFADLGVWPPHAVVKVDDTGPGIAEALAAGSWAVGVAVSGNAVGLSLAEWQALGREEQRMRREAAEGELRAAGAHEVVDTVAELLPTLDRLHRRIAANERP